MKNQELLYRAMQLSDKQEVEQLIKQFILSNSLQPGNKFNPYDFAAKKDRYRPIFNGVHYEDGYMYATDGYLAIKIKQEYAPELERKTIDRQGEELGENFPNVNRVLPAKEKLTFEKIDFKRVLEVEKEFKTDKKVNKELKFAVVKVGDTYLGIELLAKIAKFAIYFDINEIGVQSPDKCVIVTDEINTALLMPVIYKDQKVYQL